MEYVTPYVHLIIRNHILIGTYEKGIKINLDIAQEIVHARIAFTRGKKMTAIIIGYGIISMDKSAREFLASDEGIQGLSAIAILIDSTYSNFIGNLFLKMNKTKIPVRIFLDSQKAEKWLQKFKVMD
ncbi:MAG: hypothetical protein ABI185_10875 [Ginsengibacter sp.]